MKTLDRTRDFGLAIGSEHRFEQDGKRFDAHGNCMDEPRQALAPKPAASVKVETADSQVAEQLKANGASTDEGGGAGSTTELETLGLSAKVMAALRGSEITTVEHLEKCTDEQLIALPNIGPAAVKLIKAGLKAAGKKLAKK